MNKFFLFLAALTIMSQSSFAQMGSKPPTQELLKLPVAPTPNAAALGKFGDIPVGLSTGIPSIGIPIYSYQNKEKSLELSVGLNYHAGGHRVEDMASNCGLGWSLDAGGMVTRTVNGLPDDYLWGFLSTDTLPYFYTQPDENFHYVSGVSSTIGTHIAITKDENLSAWLKIKDIQERYKDGEPDLFSFNVGGLSGKFIIQKNLQVQLFTQSNVSITLDTSMISNYIVSINSFTILDKNTGVSYFFDITETTTPSSINLQTLYGSTPYSTIPSYKSGWYVSKIKSADGLDSIKFSYSDVGMEYEAGFSESQTAELQGPRSSGLLTPQERQWSFMQLSVNSKHIRSIYLPDNTEVDFTYGFPRLDMSGDSALIGVEIKNGSFRKKFNLSYDYFESSSCQQAESNCSVYGSDNDYYKRLRLLKVQQSNGGTDTLPSYLFEYNSTPLPTRKSTAIDHWGYYKGGLSGCLMPEFNFPGFPDYFSVLGCANRDPVEAYAKAWNLEKLTYPTGGYTKFYYEINKAFGEHYKIDHRIDTGLVSESDYNEYVSVPFSNRTDTMVNFIIKLYADTSSHGQPSVPWGCDFHYTIRSTDSSYSTTITATIEQFLNGYSDTVSLPLNKEYELKFTSECVWLPSTYYSDVFYRYKIVPLDKPIGGLRVSKTEDYDGVNSIPVVSNYTYLNTDGYSSGEFQNLPNYHYYYSSLNEWARDEYGMPLPYSWPRYYIHRTSTPSQSLSYFRGSPVIYKRVKVDKTNNGSSSGYSIHEFTTFASTHVLTEDYPFVQKQDLEWRQGLSTKDSVFSSTNQLFKTAENEYEYFEITPNNGYGRGMLTSMIQDDDLETPNNLVYGARAYYYMSGRAELKRTKSRDFTGSQYVESTIDYFYDPSNYLLTKQRTLNSLGDSLETRIYYPGNYNSTGLPYDVVGDNGEGEIVSEELWMKRGGYWYFKGATVNDYAPFSSVVRKNRIITAENLEPLPVSTVGEFNPSQLKRHSSFKDQVEILKYDSKGRYTEVRNINNHKTALIWATTDDVPVAQITNADESNVAYSSFEESNVTGGWSFSGQPSADPLSPTGLKCYNLSGGNITKSNLTSATYIVSYWGKNGSVSVNSNNPTRSGKIVGNWRYYEHEVTGTSITVSGTKYIDELRLYPKGAMMTTYTYLPLRGISSQCDAGNRIAYYDYDSLGRLTLVRDLDRNILKRICYNYAGQPENCGQPCTNTTANWQNTASALRCKVNGSNENTGEREQEQLDINPCSSTYGQTRWIVVDTNTTACPLPGITVTYQNISSSAGFTAVYTNNSTSQTYTFNIPGSGSGNLGTIPAGTYTLTISKPDPGGIEILLLFGSGCHYQSGTHTATFYNVDAEDCHAITIDYDLM